MDGGLVADVIGLVTGTAAWAVSNALPIAVGAVLGSELAGAALGVVSDILGRAKDLVAGAASKMSAKK